jgi:hypothetical protein
MAEQRTLVSEEEWLYRRGYSTPEKKYMNPDGTAHSRVFRLKEKDNGELSVDVRSMTTPEKSIGDASKFMLFEVANLSVLSMGLTTFHDPCTTEIHSFDNPAHAVIVGMSDDDDVLPGLLARKSKRVYF